MEFDLAYTNASTLLFPSFDKGGKIVQIGCGGTGSWLAQDIARILRSLKNPRIEYLIFDPDVVEAKNVQRQNFCDAEIGRNKAVSMASRLTYGWGVLVTGVPQTFTTAKSFSYGPILIVGCVDNAAARRMIHKTVAQRSDTWWLDCGNHASSGQVLLGNTNTTLKMADQFPFVRKANKLPSPSLQHPELLRERRKVVESCAEIVDPQGLTVNRMVAAIAADYIMRLLVRKDLKRYATYFDMGSMSTRSNYIPAGD